MDMSVFDEYIIHVVHGEPEQKEKADAWQTAIACHDGVGQDFALPLGITLEYKRNQYLSYRNVWHF